MVCAEMPQQWPREHAAVLARYAFSALTREGGTRAFYDSPPEPLGKCLWIEFRSPEAAFAWAGHRGSFVGQVMATGPPAGYNFTAAWGPELPDLDSFTGGQSAVHDRRYRSFSPIQEV